MTKRRMLLLIIGSLITVSTAVGVGVNFATANGSSQASLKGIDTSSPIIRDGEETDVIDKKENKSPSTPPAKVEINDKRKVSQTQIKDKQEPVKQTTPPTNSPVVVRKEGGTSNTNNKGTQLIIGDASKLNLPQKSNKEESKDNKPKPAVAIIKNTPTPPPTQEVEKNEEQSGSSKQNSTDASVVLEVPPQPQQTPPQHNEESANKESSQQQSQGEVGQQKDTESNVQAPKGQKDNQGETSSKQEEVKQEKLESSKQNSQSTDQSPTKEVNLIDGAQNQEQQPAEPQRQLTEQETRVLTTISEFKKVKTRDDLNEFMKKYTIRPEDTETFFANIPKDWISNNEKQNYLRDFWTHNKYNVSEGLAQDALTTPWFRQYNDDGPNREFNRYLGLAESGQLNGKIISGADNFIVKGVPEAKKVDGEKP